MPRAESLGVQVSAAPAASLSAPDPSPPTGVPPPVPHPPPSLFQQVEGGVRWMIRNSIQGADLQLHPESLGRVRIVLQVEGQDVRARLWVSDPKSIPVLMQHKGILEVSLQEQGLNLGGFDLQQQANPHPRPWTQPDSNRTWPTEAVPGPPRQDSPNPAPARRGRPRGIELLA
ncbi:MAG: flagellar hook-length control protein FliK [Acidobacteria bacterium]|nr:flagellar hook-length control protein FliK [Acidobacteriota bacterium]